MRNLVSLCLLSAVAVLAGCNRESSPPATPTPEQGGAVGGPPAAVGDSTASLGGKAIGQAPAAYLPPSIILPVQNSPVPDLAALVTPEMVAVATVKPSQVWDWPLLQNLIKQLQMEAMVNEQLQDISEALAHPRDVKRLTFYLDRRTYADLQNGGLIRDAEVGRPVAIGPDGEILDEFNADNPEEPAEKAPEEEPPMPTILIETVRPFPWRKFATMVPPSIEVGQHNEHQYLKSASPSGKTIATVVSFGSNCALVAPEDLLKKMLEQQGSSTPVGKKLAELANSDAALVINVASNRDLAKTAAESAPVAQGLAEVDLLSVSTSATSGTGASLISVQLTAADDATADKLKQQYAPILAEVKGEYEEASQKMPLLAIPLLQDFVKGLEIKQEGTQLSINSSVPGDLEETLISVVTPMVLAAQQAANEQIPLNNLKILILGVHSYMDLNNKLVPLGGPELENNKLSWRVHLLPFIDHRQLYMKFDLNAPWDSPQNKALLEEMPDVFKTEGVNEPGMTAIHAFEGEETPLISQSRGSFGAIRDGLSHTGLFFIGGSDTAVPWTKPGGLPFGPDTDPVESLGNVPGDTISVGMADGTAVRFPKDSENLRALIGYNDGQQVQFPD